MLSFFFTSKISAPKKLGAPQQFFAPERAPLASGAICPSLFHQKEKEKYMQQKNLFCLLAMLEKQRKTLVEGGKTGAVLNDLSKGFDCTGHNLLIVKLSAYGFDSNRFDNINLLRLMWILIGVLQIRQNLPLPLQKKHVISYREIPHHFHYTKNLLNKCNELVTK